MSNRDSQPVRFCCQDCGAPIDITIHKDKGAELNGAHQVPDKIPFDSSTNFVDLHLDFPVSFEKYVMGSTPFMRAARRIGENQLALHNVRLNQLNASETHAKVFALLLKLYERERWTPFKLSCERNFGEKVRSDKPQDLNAALYSVIAKVMSPFAYPGQNKAASDHFARILIDLGNHQKEPMAAFMKEILETNFLKNLQFDCLNIYPRILDAELPMRPALFLDFDEKYKEEKISMRVSTANFLAYKDLFKDIAEILSRQLVLVAGVNNLIKRKDHNAFMPEIGKTKGGRDFTPKSINEFADVPFGNKMNFIDDPIFEPLEGAANNQLRNAIAHNKLNYDEITQVIEYFPRREGILEEKGEKITFLDFMYQLLLAYRQMHSLHHLVKGLFYYIYLGPK
jgi:hypothetical protein